MIQPPKPPGSSSPPSAIYFPIDRGLYEVAPGLRPLGFDFGNGSWDAHVFQIDDDFPRFRKNKLQCRRERLSKYEQRHDFPTSHENEVARVLVELLLRDHPEFFILESLGRGGEGESADAGAVAERGTGGAGAERGTGPGTGPSEVRAAGAAQILRCLHTGDELSFDPDFTLLTFTSRSFAARSMVSRALSPSSSASSAAPPPDSQTTVAELPHPASALDALALQFPEDIALTRRQDGRDWIAYLNLCSPSHWAAEDKIGLNFSSVHESIPHIEKITRSSSNLIEAMINKGPFVRFVWSFVTDQRLNHHPIAPEGWDAGEWKGRSFRPVPGPVAQSAASAHDNTANPSADIPDSDSPFYFRVERQVIYGLPQIEASLFTIRVSFLSGSAIKNNAHRRAQLISALESMSPESRIYKGVSSCYNELMHWLQN